MRSRFTSALVASLVGGTLLTPSVLGQESTGQDQQGQGCEALSGLIQERSDQLRPEWVEEANAVVTTGVAADCTAYHEQASTALNNLDRGVQAEGEEAGASARIVVTQPDASVNVQQPPPEVSVTQPQPQVTVNQGRPEVLVRQTPPNVRVQVPQPTITIDQPPPEIIITMPEPDVNVATPEPQVEVRQAPPQVSVEQGEPQVQVQAQPEAGGDGEADVEVQQGEARVVQQAAEGQPQVDVQQQEPVIRYEAAEPNVQVESQGEPQIQFTQEGEPNIQVRRAGEEQAAAAQNAQQQPEDGQAAGQQPTPEERNAALLQTGEPMEAGDPVAYNVADVIGQPVVNAQGQELGTVDRLVVVNDRQYAILARGGFLGFGEEEVALPLDSMSVTDGGLLMRGMSQQDVDAMATFDGANAQQIAADQQVEIATP